MKHKSEKAKAFEEMICIFEKLSAEGKAKSADYAEGVKDALCAVNLITKL